MKKRPTRRPAPAPLLPTAPALRISAGTWKGRKIQSPPGLEPTRPSPGILKEAFFSMLGPEVAMGPFLDLYAGTGAVAFEALSRGAPSAVAVEKHPEALKCLRKSQEDLKADDLRIDCIDFRQFLLKNIGADFSVAFADPPFGDIPDDLLDVLLRVVRPGGIAALQLPREHLDRWADREDVKVRRYGASLLVVVRKPLST